MQGRIVNEDSYKGGVLRNRETRTWFKESPQENAEEGRVFAVDMENVRDSEVVLLGRVASLTHQNSVPSLAHKETDVDVAHPHT